MSEERSRVNLARALRTGPDRPGPQGHEGTR